MMKSGILIIDKPLRISSHDCVRTVRHVFNTKKVGHSGTLDVEASGVLVLAINKATKLLNYLNQDDKMYRFRIVFGVSTDTLDHTGTISAKKAVPSNEKIDQAIAQFPSDYAQKPPAYSAVKVQGKKLYEYARKGEAIPDVASRDLTIKRFARISPFVQKADGTVEADFEVEATKGLYVRKLAEDLASMVNTVAHTSVIRRLKAGDFTIEQAVPLERVHAALPLISMNASLASLPSVTITKKKRQYLENGRPLSLPLNAPIVKCLDESGRLLAIYEKDGNHYTAKNVLT